jgi:hypothetical protein
MANKNTKAASRKAAAKQNPEQVPAEQPADIVPDQPQADPEPDGSEAPELAPASTEQPDTAPASEQVPAEKEAPAKSAARSSGKAPAAKKTIRDTAAQTVAKQVFRSHPDKQTVYVTSDGTPFFGKCDADNHGRTLDDKLVVAVTNENYKA